MIFLDFIDFLERGCENHDQLVVKENASFNKHFLVTITNDILSSFQIVDPAAVEIRLRPLQYRGGNRNWNDVRRCSIGRSTANSFWHVWGTASVNTRRDGLMIYHQFLHHGVWDQPTATTSLLLSPSTPLWSDIPLQPSIPPLSSTLNTSSSRSLAKGRTDV